MNQSVFLKVILLFVFQLSFTLFAQTDKRQDIYDQHNIDKTQKNARKQVYETLAEIFPDDRIFVILSQHMPLMWQYEYFNDTLVIKSKLPLYYLPDSIQNDSTLKGRGMMKKIQLHPADTARIVIRLEPLWSGEKVSDAIIHNQHLQAQIDRLKKKYNVMHLNDFIQSPEFRCDADFLSDKERKSMIKFCQEKILIEQQMITLPDYHTSNYSLFFVHIFPGRNQSQAFFPESVLKDMEQIFRAFEKNAGK